MGYAQLMYTATCVPFLYLLASMKHVRQMKGISKTGGISLAFIYIQQEESEAPLRA